MQKLLCAVAASRRMKLMTADARGAFFVGVRGSGERGRSGEGVKGGKRVHFSEVRALKHGGGQHQKKTGETMTTNMSRRKMHSPCGIFACRPTGYTHLVHSKTRAALS